MTKKNEKYVIELLNILKEDAEMALDGSWDCTTQEGIETGFNAQITLIDECLNKIEDDRRGKKNRK